MKVLVVCSGNICRSPMAAEYLRHRAAQRGLSHLVVDSAGTLGIVGAPASPEAVATLREVGLDLSGHRSKGLSETETQNSDLVIAMTREHMDELAALAPNRAATHHLLCAFERGAEPDPEAGDLADPIGDPIEVYRETFGVIRTCVDHLVLYLRHLAPGRGAD